MTQLKAFATSLAFVVVLMFHSFAQKDSTTSLVGKVSSGFKIDESRRLFAEGNIRAALVGFREAFNKDPYSAKAAKQTHVEYCPHNQVQPWYKH